MGTKSHWGCSDPSGLTVGASVLSLFFASIYVMALLECELVSFCEALEVGIQMRAPGMGRWLGGADAHHVRTGT